jgi:hypothetical protein
MTSLPVSTVIDHDLFSTKLVISFHSNLGNVSLRVKTKFSRENIEEIREYKDLVHKVFTDIYDDYTKKSKDRTSK